jgi:iron complex transport system substrate-binding protein
MKVKRFLIISIIGILAITSLSLGLYFVFKTPPAVGITIADDLDRTVYINGIPKRIVSHVPSITEIIFALGLGERVVGVSDYCDYPEEATLKPSVGNYFDPSIEKIVELDPDLVLTDGHSEGVKQLDSLGITYMVIDPKDIDGIFKDIELLGKVTGTEKNAEKLIGEMQENMAYVLDQVKDAPKVKVFYIIDAQAQSAWVQFSLEAVVAADPEIIILPAKHGTAFTTPAALKEHPAWRETTAVKENRIYIIDADLVDRSGPRIVQGLNEIARIIHPELF